MLNDLKKIVQSVSGAKSLQEALDNIVQHVQQALSVDVVSVYLMESVEQPNGHQVDSNNQQHELVLRASNGLKTEAIGALRMGLHEGLVGLVAQRAEPVNLDAASMHSRYKYFPESGEEVLHSFLGVPIIHFAQVRGVLVVQQKTPRLFDEDQVAFLITLAAQIAGAIAQAQANQSTPEPNFLMRALVGKEKPVRRLKGLPGATGVTIGTAKVLYPMAELRAVPDKSPASIADEQYLFEQAVAATRASLQNIAHGMLEVLPKEEAALFEAYDMMLSSGSLIDDTLRAIEQGNWAQGALRQTVEQHVKRFEQMDESYFQERAEDVKDLGQRVLMQLQDKRPSEQDDWPEKTILVGDNILATHLAEVPVDKLAGIVSVHGSNSSHVAILAKALEVPAVLGVTDLLVNTIDGKELVVDGYAGAIIIQPNWTLKREFQRLIRQEQQMLAALKELAPLPACTVDGQKVILQANTGLVSGLVPSHIGGAQGIGLYRTEIPFQLRSRFPSEEEQFELYHEVLKSFAPRPVVLRTLDIGGDKPLDYFPIEEDNPFLGWRGIRISLDHPELFLTQVRAMLRANADYHNLSILLPMISDMRELRQAKRWIAQAYEELQEEGFEISKPRVGIMIEVPSVLYLLEAMAQHVDFFSIGTNDLTQYLLAVDRNNERVAQLFNAFHPAVLHAILKAVDVAQRNNVPLSVCGELAGDPLGALCLLGMGVQNMSMSVGSLLRVKKVIRSFSLEEAKDIVSAALIFEEGEQVRAHLIQAMEEKGLGGLVRAGA